MCTEKCLFRQKPKGWQIANRVASTPYGGQRKVARVLGVLDRRPPIIDGHEKPLDYQRSCFFPSLVRSKQTIPSSRPVLPSVWLQAAVKHGRRPPRQRRVACLRAARSHTTLGRRRARFHFRFPASLTANGKLKWEVHQKPCS